MATILTGEAGPSVTSHAVEGTGSGHVRALTLYQSMAGSTALIWEPLCSLMCVTQDLVHVSYKSVVKVQRYDHDKVDVTKNAF